MWLCVHSDAGDKMCLCLHCGIAAGGFLRPLLPCLPPPLPPPLTLTIYTVLGENDTDTTSRRCWSCITTPVPRWYVKWWEGRGLTTYMRLSPVMLSSPMAYLYVHYFRSNSLYMMEHFLFQRSLNSSGPIVFDSMISISL